MANANSLSQYGSGHSGQLTTGNINSGAAAAWQFIGELARAVKFLTCFAQNLGNRNFKEQVSFLLKNCDSKASDINREVKNIKKVFAIKK